MRRAIEAELPAIVAKLTDLALAGDVSAAKLLLDRCLPPLRAVDSPAMLPAAEGLTDIGAAGRAVLASLTAGQTTPTEASTMAGALSSLARVHETTELAQRVAALEGARQADGTQPPKLGSQSASEVMQ